MSQVKFLKPFAGNQIGKIVEFDKELCDKLIKRGVAVKPSKADLEEAKKIEEARKEAGKVAHKEAIKRAKIYRGLHNPIDVAHNKKAIALVRAENKKKAKKKK